MVTKTILRIPEGIELSQEMSAQLQTILGECEVRSYQSAANYQEMYQRRIDIIEKAFDFICTTIPPKPPAKIESMRMYGQWCKDKAKLDQNLTQKQYQAILVNYTGSLLAVLGENWDWTGEKDRLHGAIELLNKAEQYAIMQQGVRPGVATLSSFTNRGKKEFILQYDQPLPCCSEETIKDLKLIQQTFLSDIPDWLKNLPYYQQLFFLQAPKHCQTFEDMAKEANDFIKQFRLLNKGDVISREDKQRIIEDKRKNLPEWYCQMSVSQRRVIRALILTNKDVKTGLTDLTVKLTELQKSALSGEVTQLRTKLKGFPDWFIELPLKEQKLLKASLKPRKVGDVEIAVPVEEAVNFLPTRLRTIPGLANLAKHHCYILNENCSVETKFVERLRSSHLASRDVATRYKYPPEIGELHVKRNLNEIFKIAGQLERKRANGDKKKPILIQTLISPNYWLQSKLPDYGLDKAKKEGLLRSEFADVFDTNHPLNYERLIHYTESTSPECNNLLNEALAYLAELKAISSPAMEAQIKALEELTANYRDVLYSKSGTATWYDYGLRELFLSSLENLIITHMDGVSYGSCVSGKDRKAVESIHTDAMQIYYKTYGEFPKHNEARAILRKQFVEIVADLYVTRHSHAFADQNAPGTEGIKTPAVYWPADIAAAIEKKWGPDSLKEDDYCATNNEIGKMASFFEGHTGSAYHKWPMTQAVSFNYVSSATAALTLKDEQRQKLVSTVFSITSQEKYWQSKKNYSYFVGGVPKGVSCLKKIFHKKQDEVSTLADIFFDVVNRPEDSSRRDPDTAKLYTNLLNLKNFNPQDKVANHPEVLLSKAELVGDITIFDYCMGKLDNLEKEIEAWNLSKNNQPQSHVLSC